MVRKTRRRILSTGTAAIALLAGCTGDGGGGGDGGEGTTTDGGTETDADETETAGGDGGGSEESETVVEMNDDLEFVQETVEISGSETVTWENVGTVGHTVTAYEDKIPEEADYFASGGFDSEGAARDAYAPGDTDAGEIPEGETYSYTFEEIGTYEYFCIPHEGAGMTGTVNVTES